MKHRTTDHLLARLNSTDPVAQMSLGDHQVAIRHHSFLAPVISDQSRFLGMASWGILSAVKFR